MGSVTVMFLDGKEEEFENVSVFEEDESGCLLIETPDFFTKISAGQWLSYSLPREANPK